ncbi:MAG: glycosyltransferase 87 family protein [Anaerolineae bacterium]
MTGVRRLRYGLLAILGLALLAPYLYALSLGDLRQHTVEFLIAFFAAFVLYAAVTVLALRLEVFSWRAVAASFALAVVIQAVLLCARPALSDDMYRYVWDGRVQAQGISPYRYPPDAPELAALRDGEIWPKINRRSVVTVYPPGAEAAFALLWRVVPDDVRWFQAVMAAGGLLAGGLLLGLLRALGRSPARILIYLWSPLLAFETAHAAHVDGLVLPLLVGAWWARVRERDSLVGLLLGLAAALKLYPVLLLPALWRPRHPQGRWRLPLAFVLSLGACYLPYIWTSGPQVLGYLPRYFGERFNMGLAGLLIPQLERLGLDPDRGVLVLTLSVLALLGLGMILRSAEDGEAAVRRCVWLIGAFTLLTQNLFSWYLLWLLPLVALCVQPGRLLGLRADAWTSWWLFCGLVALSYTFFIRWEPVPAALWLQFAPLYGLLLWDLGRFLRERRFDWQTVRRQVAR